MVYLIQQKEEKRQAEYGYKSEKQLETSHTKSVRDIHSTRDDYKENYTPNQVSNFKEI